MLMLDSIGSPAGDTLAFYLIIQLIRHASSARSLTNTGHDLSYTIIFIWSLLTHLIGDITKVNKSKIL
jgi:hypothetical protein